VLSILLGHISRAQCFLRVPAYSHGIMFLLVSICDHSSRHRLFYLSRSVPVPWRVAWWLALGWPTWPTQRVPPSLNDLLLFNGANNSDLGK